MGLYNGSHVKAQLCEAKVERRAHSFFRLLWMTIKHWKRVKIVIQDFLEYNLYDTKVQRDYLTKEEVQSANKYKLEYSYDGGCGQQNPTYRAMVFEVQIDKDDSKPYWCLCGDAISHRSCEDARQLLVKEIATRKEVSRKNPSYITEEDLDLQKSFL